MTAYSKYQKQFVFCHLPSYIPSPLGGRCALDNTLLASFPGFREEERAWYTLCARMRELQGRDCVSHVLRCLVGMHERVAEHEQTVCTRVFFFPPTH